MRRHNSVGGYRIYPSSPQVSELLGRATNAVSVFREGMDRLNTQRQLTYEQHQQLNHLDQSHQLRQKNSV